jgi:hypothetical protein
MIPEDAELKAILFQVKAARAELVRIEREAEGELDLLSVIRQLDEIIRRLDQRGPTITP